MRVTCSQYENALALTTVGAVVVVAVEPVAAADASAIDPRRLDPADPPAAPEDVTPRARRPSTDRRRPEAAPGAENPEPGKMK